MNNVGEIKISMIELLNIECIAFMKTCEDKFFDLAICDPPYGIDDWNKRGSNANSMAGIASEKIKSWDVKPGAEYFNELFRVSKAQIIWGANHFFDFLGSTKAMIIWDKMLDGMHFNHCEIAWANNLNESIKIYRLASSSQIDRIHPTQKPVKLYKWLLHNYAKEGDRILDTHGGSMSIALACHDYKFDLTLCEIDKDYYDAGVKRFTDCKKQLKIW